MIYTGYECPVCSNKFTDKDDVVVCPVCGTPHHRECWKILGHCANEEKHAEGFVWQAPELKKDEPEDTQNTKAEVLICPRCGLPNPPGEHFCARCKMPLGADDEKSDEYNGQNAPFNAPNPAGGMYPYKNPYAEHAKSVFGDAKISDIPVSEAAEYIQANSDKYIAAFLESESVKPKKRFNWSAAIFSIYWMFYRKMVKLGCIATVLLVALQLIGSVGVELAFRKFDPDVIDEYNSAAISYSEKYDAFISGSSDADKAGVSQALLKLTTSEFFLTSNAVSVAIYIVFGIVTGIIGNGMYKKKMVRDILRLRTVASDDSTYHFVLRHNGGTSALNVLFPFIINYILQMLIRSI